MGKANAPRKTMPTAKRPALATTVSVGVVLAAFVATFGAALAACSSAPAPRPTPQERYKLAFEPSDHQDTPCTARQPASLLNALHTRVHNRIEVPTGFVVVLPDGPQIAPIMQTDVKVTIHPNGRILNSAVTKSSTVPALDGAVLSALQKAVCMPAPPKELIDPASNSMRIQVSYRFRKGSPAAALQPAKAPVVQAPGNPAPANPAVANPAVANPAVANPALTNPPPANSPVSNPTPARPAANPTSN